METDQLILTRPKCFSIKTEIEKSGAIKNRDRNLNESSFLANLSKTQTLPESLW